MSEVRPISETIKYSDGSEKTINYNEIEETETILGTVEELTETVEEAPVEETTVEEPVENPEVVEETTVESVEETA